jgi:hypothetical protein
MFIITNLIAVRYFGDEHADRCTDDNEHTVGYFPHGNEYYIGI